MSLPFVIIWNRYQNRKLIIIIYLFIQAYIVKHNI